MNLRLPILPRPAHQYRDVLVVRDHLPYAGMTESNPALHSFGVGSIHSVELMRRVNGGTVIATPAADRRSLLARLFSR